MAYQGQSDLYRIPFTKEGDQLSEAEEETIVTIIENQLRGGILAAGGTRVFDEGSFTTVINPDNTVIVTLSGNPAVQGIADQGLIEVAGSVVWQDIPTGDSFFLYVRTNESTYEEPGNVDAIFDTTLITRTDHLLLATLDNTIPGSPVLDTNPPEKPTGANLFELLNGIGTDPFGDTLTQTNLFVTNELRVTNGAGKTVTIRQLNAAATLPLLTFTNSSSQPDIKGGTELKLADSRTVAAGLALTDTDFSTLPLGGASIVGAINKIAKTPAIALTDEATIATDVATGNTFAVTLGASRTLGNPTNSTGGQRVVWRIRQDGTGSRILSLGSDFRLGTDISSVVLSTDLDKTDYLEAIYQEDDAKWDVIRFVRGY